MLEILPDYTSGQWLIIAMCAFLVGVSKTGVPGIGILNVPLIAMAFADTKMSTGLLLPILAMADIFAVVYYRRHAQWKYILRLLPWALLGIAAGSVVIRYIDNNQLKPLIGIIILVLLGLNFWRQRHPDKLEHLPSHWCFAALMGFAAGMTTQLANAAGPIMVIYLLAMRLPKNQYIGTGAWYFLILNWLKVPLFAWEGRIVPETLIADVVMLPLIAVGAITGIVILKKINQKWFNITVQVLALAAALKLALSIFKF